MRSLAEVRGFSRREGFRSYPVEVGKDYDVEVTETSRRGEGIARIKGFVVFIPETKPGDRVKVKVTKIGRRYANAKVVE